MSLISRSLIITHLRCILGGLFCLGSTQLLGLGLSFAAFGDLMSLLAPGLIPPPSPRSLQRHRRAGSPAEPPAPSPCSVQSTISAVRAAVSVAPPACSPATDPLFELLFWLLHFVNLKFPFGSYCIFCFSVSGVLSEAAVPFKSVSPDVRASASPPTDCPGLFPLEIFPGSVET